ncbi:putative F-box/LRR-repeat protein At3g18150 [Herrania umbratica]|uniref:F-box/LRR-repeat protein At3g18150 n=1 Tax=Herrania umbratica TaxID=108875 RepID=A0A6J1BN16_9ROSI|nr:putative F-box/LRR-repeat protein At3g18150 [Herrania umbratica]
MAPLNSSAKSLILDHTGATSVRGYRFHVQTPGLVSLCLPGSIDIEDVSSLAVSSVFFSFGFKCALKRYREVVMDGTDDIDRISSLPESLLLHILSFLPAKDAVRTALIAPRFGHLWAFLPTLSFNFCSYQNCKTRAYDHGPEYNENFLDFLYYLLLLHQSNTIDKFHLDLELNFCHKMDEGTCSNPDHQEKNVTVLHLDFVGCGLAEPNASYRLPKYVFSRGSLDDNIMDRILSGCSVLGELSLLDCHGLSRLPFRNPGIKSLAVKIWYERQRLEISCPNIVSLDLSGEIDYLDLVDVSSMILFAEEKNFLYVWR